MTTPFFRLSILALFASLIFIACQGGDGQDTAGYTECYYGATDRDTTSLAFNQTGNQVKGIMWTHYFNVPRQEGTYKGHWKGDTLMGEFRYADVEAETEAEIIREVHFLRLPEGNLIEGFGDRLTVDGKDVYAHSGFLNYSHTLPLTKKDCR